MTSTFVEGIEVFLYSFHSVEPFIFAGDLDDCDQPVLDVLGGLEDDFVPGKGLDFPVIGEIVGDRDPVEVVAEPHFGVQDIADGAVEGFFIDDVGGPDQEGVAVRSGVAVVPFAVCLVEFRCRVDLLQGPFVQPAVDFAQGIACYLGRFGGLLKSPFGGCGISAAGRNAMTVKKHNG
ncbi:MAG: hypothetical protein ACYTAO_12665 [Planctomycetota bacterium]